MMDRLKIMLVFCFFSVGCVAPKVYRGPHVIDLEKPFHADISSHKKRKLVLANGLEVLLISDPNVRQSALSLDVAVGSMDDPDDYPGLAHLLEHMLLLSSSDAPEKKGFESFLRAHQGEKSSYTTSDHTNFSFLIEPGSFGRAIRYFSSFFIKPRFSSRYLASEIGAVHDEFLRGAENESLRMAEVLKYLHRKEFAGRRFGAGNATSLSGVSISRVEQFYLANYSANMMKLAVVAPETLDVLEQEVSGVFSQIHNSGRPLPSYGDERWDDALLPARVNVQTRGESAYVTLVFQLPSQYPLWESKPGLVLAHLVGHEGPGSLLSQLKEDGDATALTAGVRTNARVSYFQVSIQLTGKGQERVARVRGAFYSYLEMLRQEGYRYYVYAELKHMLMLDHLFGVREPWISTISDYASKMHCFDVNDIGDMSWVLPRHDEQLFISWLSLISPEREVLLYASPDPLDGTSISPIIEPNYKTVFTCCSSSLDRSKEALALIPQKRYRYPDANAYAFDKVVLHDKDVRLNPYRLLDSADVDFWFFQRGDLEDPRSEIIVQLLSASYGSGPKPVALSMLYEIALNDQLSELQYVALMAGVKFGVTRTDRGMSFRFSGYSPRILDVVRDVFSRERLISIIPTRFAHYRDVLFERLSRFSLSQAYQSALYELSYMMRSELVHYRELLAVLREISSNDLLAYTNVLIDKVGIEGVAYGNLDPAEVRGVLHQLHERLGAEHFDRSEWPKERLAKLFRGRSFAYAMNSDGESSCWASLYQFGGNSRKSNAILRIAHGFLAPLFRREMVERYRVGEVAFSQLLFQKGVGELVFVVQSEQRSPSDIAKFVSQWMKMVIARLGMMSEEQLQQIKDRVAVGLQEKAMGFSEGFEYQLVKINAMGLDGVLPSLLADDVRGVAKEELVSFFIEEFAQQQTSLTVYLASRRSALLQPSEMMILDAKEFKKTIPTY